MYEARGIGVTIGNRAILSGIDLALAPGKVTVLIGPNGAGKSTLLKVMAGERRPSAGSVHLHGRPLARTGAAELAALRAVLPQSVVLAFPFRVREVIRMGLPQAMPKGRADDIVERALAAVWLAALADSEATTLSGGEQQRAHLARVLAQLWAAPDLGLARYLLLDEPTASLDLAHQLLVLQVARAHAEAGGGVLAVMHDLNLAAMMGDRVVAVAGGRIVADGPPVAVIDDRLLAGTYRTDLKVGVAPESVFVLPQSGDPRSGLPRKA